MKKQRVKFPWYLYWKNKTYKLPLRQSIQDKLQRKDSQNPRWFYIYVFFLYISDVNLEGFLFGAILVVVLMPFSKISKQPLLRDCGTSTKPPRPSQLNAWFLGPPSESGRNDARNFCAKFGACTQNCTKQPFFVAKPPYYLSEFVPRLSPMRITKRSVILLWSYIFLSIWYQHLPTNKAASKENGHKPGRVVLAAGLEVKKCF